jgi:hypothetical protein
MGRKSLQVKGYSPESIKALFNSDDRYKIGMRLYAVYQVSLGQPSRKLEDFYNTSFKQITNWVHRFEREGLCPIPQQYIINGVKKESSPQFHVVYFT